MVVERTGDWDTVEVLGESASFEPVYPPLRQFLRYLTESRLVGQQELEAFLADRPGMQEDHTELLADALMAHGLLNEFQIKRLINGQTFGLVLGNYRVLDRLGAGGMGVVYKAEHVHMKRPVALKVLATDADDTVFLQRFSSEMQALAVLHHPNIVLAFDAGETEVPGEPGKKLRYLVMEYVPGQNLEQFVLERPPLPIAVACEYVRQAAHGLRHAHEHGLIHRDIKPSNLLVTGLPTAADPQTQSASVLTRGQIKILDFGLARLCRRRYTEANALLGTVDYMAPEQARDARSVDIRADIYALGGTLYWLLTGRRPFPSDRPPLEELLARQHETPAPIRSIRPEIPLELEMIVCQMMARDPSDRYPTPLAVITALNAFLEPTSALSPTSATVVSRTGTRVSEARNGEAAQPLAGASEKGPSAPARRVLVVSPQVRYRFSCRNALKALGIECVEAQRATEVRDLLDRFPCDLVLVDSQLVEGSGLDLCRRLRTEAPIPHLKLILLLANPITEAAVAAADPSCDDHVSRAAPASELAARVRLALRLKEAEERTERLESHLLATNSQLEQIVQQRDNTDHQAQDVLIFAMAKMAEMRGQETGEHLLRMQAYVRVLAEEARSLPAFASAIDDSFVRMIERCVLLHDIGKVGIPDYILLKPGKLDAEERSIMESHTTLGANMLEAVARRHGANLAFLQMAIDVTRHHHESYDGSGYPGGLVGEAIPLAARITTIADVYDALRSKLVYKPGLSHVAARRILLNPTQGQFDPALIAAFRQCEAGFEQIFEQSGK
jgi:response regulator RpfG family c-di-GMP phosphodiesterase/serine/threonine protein kinase